MTVTLRPAQPSDVDAVLALWASGAENRGRPTDTGTAVGRLLARDPAALILAVVEGTPAPEVVGSIVVGWDGWRCHLYRLAVRPERRRQGIGQALIEAALARARQLGATRVDAMVLAANDLGQSIWRSSGFVQQPDWRRWVITM